VNVATAAPARVLAKVLEAIGGTPLLRLSLPGIPPGVELWGKCEWWNPGGSIKDRTALSILEDGERRGALRPGKTIIDSSSGNTAVGLALVESVSDERKRLCRAYGARIVETAAFSGSDGALRQVRETVAREGDRYFYADQYRNPANPLAHYRTTGPEIWEQTSGRITHFVAGLGTTGTIVGTGRYLHERNPQVRIVAVEPDEPLHGLEGLKHLASAIVPEVYDPGVQDEKATVSTEEALRMCQRVLDSDAVLIGHSAGAALHAAHDLCTRLTRGVVVALLSDGGERYLSEYIGR
jgi:cysteine synthase B